MPLHSLRHERMHRLLSFLAYLCVSAGVTRMVKFHGQPQSV